MPALKIEQIGGMLPAWDPHLLPAGQAADCQNLYAFSGRMEGWRTPKLLRNLTNSAAKFAYRVPFQQQQYAAASLVFTAAPSNGDAITVGEQTYTFSSTVTTPYTVLNTGTPQSCALNLLAALTNDNGTQSNMGIAYGVATSVNPNVGQQSSVFQAPVGVGGALLWVLNIQAAVVGAAFNGLFCGVTTQVSGKLYMVSQLLPPYTNYVTGTMSGGVNPSLNTDITSPNVTWLEFVDPDTTVVRSQVLNDVWNRFYFASPSTVPQYNTAARIQQQLPPLSLGINPPTVAPTVATAGGGQIFPFNNANAVSSGVGTDYDETSNVGIGGTAMVTFPIVPTANGTIDSISFEPYFNTNAASQWVAVLYSDSGQGLNGTVPTLPYQLLGTGAILGPVAGGNLYTSIFQNPITILANTVYWIGVILLGDSTFGDNISFQGASVGATPASSGLYTNAFAWANGPPPVYPSSYLPYTATLLHASAHGPMIYATVTTSNVIEARAYVFTYVTQFGEESAPSPFTLVNGYSNGNWSVLMAQPPPADINGTDRLITNFRVYRTVTGTSGSTAYFWIADVPIATTLYVDNSQDSVIAEHIQLPSTQYFPPPANLQGLVNLPNGMTVGWIGNQVWFAQPFLPHAWPPGNVFTTEFPIVGMAWSNGALIIATSANPYVMTGTTPGTMSISKCSLPAPCSSRGSILGTDLGVYYISPQGLIQVTNLAQATNTTELWVTREKWAALAPQKYGRAIQLGGCYFCYGTNSPPAVQPPDSSVAMTGFTVELNQDNTSFTIWPQPGGHRVGFSKLVAPNAYPVDNILMDPWSSVALVIQNGQVYYYDFTDQSPVMQTYTYTSKVFQQNTRKNYSAMRVFFTLPPNTPPQNPGPNQLPTNDPSWNTLQAGQYGIIQVYASIDDTNVNSNGDGQLQLITTREITSSGGLLRILGGFKAEQWQFKITARVPISNIQVATSIKELGNV